MPLTEEQREKARAYGKAYRQRHPEREKARCRAWRSNNIEKARAKDRAWLKKNAEKKKADEKAWRDSHLERKRAAVKAWRAKNKERHRSVLAAWRKANPDKVKAAEARARRKASSQPAKRLKNALKAQLNAIVKGKASRTGTIQTFGYAMEQLVAHLEAHFAAGMTWENYGPKGWHVDHIHPVASFALISGDGSVDGEQIRKCYALENLQPLWAIENIRKGARMLDTQAQVLA